MSTDTIKLLCMMLVMSMILATVSIHMSEEKVVRMDLDMAVCEVDGSYYTFDIMIPVGADKEIYSSQFCDSISLDLFIANAEDEVGETDADYR